MHGGGSPNVGERNVHRGTNAAVGEQVHGRPNVANPSDLLYQKIARTTTVFCHNGKAIIQEKEAAKAEGETQAMLFAMLQEQHDKQIASMEATNKANMDAMMERMNALVVAGNNKENIVPPGTTPAGGRSTKRNFSQGSAPRQLYDVAKTNHQTNSQVLPQLGQNDQGPHQRPATGNQIHKSK